MADPLAILQDELQRAEQPVQDPIAILKDEYYTQIEQQPEAVPQPKNYGLPPRYKWNSLGPIGSGETVSRLGKSGELVPFVGMFSSVKKLHGVRSALDALDAEQKGTSDPLDDTTRTQYQDTVQEFLANYEYAQTRGYSLPAEISSVVAQMVPFAIEIWATGGIAGSARAGVGAMGKQALGMVGKGMFKRAAIKMATRGGALAAAGMTRAALMPGRIAKKYEELRMPKVHVAPNGELTINRNEDGAATAFFKAFGDVAIENISEETGSHIGKALSKIPGVDAAKQKIVHAISKAWGQTGKSSAELMRRLATKAGYHGVLEEIGEERLGDALRVVTGVDNFGLEGDENTTFNRAVAAIPSGRQLLIETASFMVPGAVQQAGARIIDRKASAMRAADEKAQLDDAVRANLRSPEGARDFVDMFPEAATEIGATSSPSRAILDKYFPDIRWSSRERMEFADAVRGALAEKNKGATVPAQEATQEAPEVAPEPVQPAAYEPEAVTEAPALEPIPEPVVQPEQPAAPVQQPIAEPEQTQQPEQSVDDNPDIRLAGAVSDALKSGKSFKNKDFFDLADQVYGGTRAEGKYRSSDAYDAMELGVNRYVGEIIASRPDAAGAKEAIGQIGQIVDRLPTQTNRTGEKDVLQQFSTPPDYAFVAAWAANIKEGDAVLEPSAGTGSLATHARTAKATVTANELSKRRAALLKSLGVDVMTEDAEHISNLIPEGKRPNVVLMNPPFSHSGERMGTTKIAGMDRRHVASALKALKPGGRLVAIIGAPMRGEESNASRQWFADIAKEYAVRAHVMVGRGVYRKYGTTFPTRMLVIDKAGPAPLPKIQNAETLEQLVDLLEGVRNAKVSPASGQAAEPTADQPVGQEVPVARETTAPVARPAQPGPAPVVAGEPAGVGAGRSGGTEGGGRDAGIPQQPGPGVEAADRGVAEGRDRGDKPGGPGGANVELAGNESAVVERVEAPVESVQPTAAASESTESSTVDENEESEITEAVFDPWKPTTNFGGKKHPGSLAESTALAAIKMPVMKTKVHIPKDVIETGRPSESQLEAVAYIAQAHNTMLPGTEIRSAGALGDGTGSGKGITLASIILDNMMQGRKKALWISKNQDLAEAARLDWQKIGQSADDIFLLNDFKASDPVDKDTGILFTSYFTMAKDYKIPAKSRLQQIINWVGADFDGVLIFDESHIMGNANKSGRKEAAAVALAGIELQNALPNARIVYSSATMFTEVRNMLYAERLGLWGPTTSFPTKEDFINAANEGGVAFMEMISQNLKAFGKYIARSLSMNDGTPEGTVDYSILEHKLTDEQKTSYDIFAKTWSLIYKNMHTMFEHLGYKGRDKANAEGMFQSSVQRFFGQVLMALQAPAMIKSIQQDLKDGNSVLIQLTNTGDAAQERAIAERENEDDEIDVTPREMLTRFLDAAFPTTIMVESIDDMGNKVTAPLLDSQGKPVEDQEAVRIREKLKDDLGMVAFPENPLDMLINHFGPDMVAEVTSRKRQILRSKDGKIQIKNRGGKGANLAEQKAFQDGKKRIVIFSKAGGTGASYHADLGAKNQQKRIHYPFQPGWEANVFFQGLGRSHRTNQKQAPSYRLITTDLPGQRRFISTIARRMEQMGALTHGNRKATGGVFKSTDNLESKEALDALRYFLLKMRDNDVADISRDEFESATGLDLENDTQFPTMGRFLNRILALPFQMQVDVMNQYLKVLEDKIELGKASGQIDQGIENYKAEKITENQTKEVYHDPESGAKAFYHKLTATHKIAVREWRDVRTAHSFVVNKKSGNIFAVEDGPDKTDDVSGRMYKTYRLRGHGDRTNIVERAELDANRSGNWQHVSDKKEAEKLWDEGLKTAPKTRENEIHLISGASLPIYHKLGRGQPRVMRMMVGKKKLLGRIISADVIEEVLQNIGVANDPVKVSSGEAFDKVMNGNIQLILDNGWKIRKMMVGGQKRIVLDGPTIYHAKALANVGVFTERVGGALKTNFFIPATQEGLAAVTTERPIVRLMSLDSTEHMAAMAPYSNTDVPGGFTNTGNTAAPTIGKHEIVSDISRIFGVKIGFGNVPKGVGGRYRTFVETARIHGREAAILAIAAHEVAHHLDKKTSIRDLWSGQAERELQAMDYEPKDRAFEGFAEYIRRWTFGDETLKSTAPMFDNWFWTQWADKNPEWVSRLEQMKDLIDRYRNQTVLKQVVANIHFDPKQSDKDVGESTTAYLARLTREAGHRFYAQHKDQFHYLHRMEKDAIKQGYKPGPGNIGPYEKALTMFQSGASLANTAIEEGVFLIGNDGQKIKRISRGLREIFEPISPKERTDFTAYAYARSAIEAWKEGTNPGIEKAQAKAVYDQLHNEKWEAVAKEWTGFNDSLIVMMADAGVLSRETAQTIIASHKNYLPFMRSAEDVRRAKDRGAALLNLPNPLKRRFGSNLPIIDPVQATIERAVRFYSAAAHQTIMNSAANLVLKTEGMGKWGEVVAPGLKATKIPMTEVNEILEDMGFTIANMESGDKISQLEEHELDDLAYSFMTIYRPDYFYRGRKPIGRVFVNGQPKMFEWDKDIYRTLSGMDVVQIPWFVRILGKFTNLMKLGATGVSAGFAVGNLIRDYPAFLIQRKHATGLKGALRAAPVPLPGTALTDYIMSLWNEMRGGEGDPVVKLWKQFGGELAQSLGMDKKKISVTADQLFGKRSTATFVNMAKHPIDALRTIISVSEVGPRIAEFEAALAKQGYTREAMKAGQVPPLGVIIPAMNASKDVTLNFQRMGYHGRVLNQIFPYWNAQLEGVDKTVRTIKDDPKRAAISIAALVSAGIVYWMRVHDEDWYKESAPWLKYGTWVITDDEGNPIARLPRPHEWNWLFVASTEAFMNRWNDEDPKAVQEWISGVTSATLPGAWPSLITPLVEVIANKDLSFTGNPIVNDTLQELPAERQFTPQTTETAKAVGRWLGWSPAKIEHFVNRVSGGLYRKATVPVEGAFTGFDKYSSADLPVIGRFMMRNDYPASLNEFYAELDDLSKEAKAEKQDGTEGVAAREFNTMDRYRNVMSAMRDLRDKASKEEAVLIDRYRIGLARQALDKDRLERYPTPWKDENAPEAVQKEMARIVGSAAYQASAARPQRQMGESIDHYRERLAEHEKSVKNAEAFLDETGLEAVDIRPMMLGEMRRRGLKTANEGAARRLRSLGDDDSDR